MKNTEIREWSLSAADLANSAQEYGKLMADRSGTGAPLKVAGTVYEHGVGTDTSSIMHIDLHGTALKISGKVGVDDANRQGAGFFSIRDTAGRLLWQSTVKHHGEEPTGFELDIAGLAGIVLMTTAVGNNKYCNFADWLEVGISYTGSVAPCTVPGPLGIVAGDIAWRIFGSEGAALLQTVFGPLDAAPEAGAPLVNAVPARDHILTLLPESLRVVQADSSHNLELHLSGSEREEISGDISVSRFRLTDPAYPVEVIVTVRLHRASQVFVTTTSVTNTGDAEIALLGRDSAFVQLPHGDIWVSSFQGEWGKEMTEFNECKVPRGIFSLRVGGTSHNLQRCFPGVFASWGGPAREETGDVFACALGWDSSWQLQLSHQKPDCNFICAGQLQTDMIKLAPGETTVSPEFVMTFSRHGKGGATRNLHRYLRGFGLRGGMAERPVVLNSWEGVVMDFDEAKLIEMMDSAVGLGIEMFVLDDGWFGNNHPRNNDRAGLGDWQVNAAKLPGGIAALVSAARKRGLKFGIWVEPEMVNPASDLFERHPDWISRTPHREPLSARTQYTLDLANPEVEAFIYDAVAELLRSNPGIEYVKWDHNMWGGYNPGSPGLGANQGAFSDRVGNAYYRIMRRLSDEFPAVIFQACSSGGGRADYGTMRYHEEFWASDVSTAIERIFIQWGFSHYYPANAIASHISRFTEVDYKLRADVAMCGRLGVELDPPAISEENREVVRKGIAAYKKLRPLLHSADLYRGRSPHEHTTTELTFAAADRSEAVCFGFRRLREAACEAVFPGGLDPEKSYFVTEENPGSEPRFAPFSAIGAELMERGVKVDFPAFESSVVIRAAIE